MVKLERIVDLSISKSKEPSIKIDLGAYISTKSSAYMCKRDITYVLEILLY